MLETRVQVIPPPEGDPDETQGLIFDSYYDSYRASLYTVFDGQGVKKVISSHDEHRQDYG